MEFVADAFKSTESKSQVANGYHQPVEDVEDFEGACSLPLPKPEKLEVVQNAEEVIQLETSKILELFPGYGVGYIRRLLAFYDSSSEKVIAALLEGLSHCCF